VMSSVADRSSGIASGINNAVSRTAGLLAIALFSILMIKAYGSCLDRRLDDMNLSVQTRSSLDKQKSKLAGTEIPANLDVRQRAALQQAVNDSFVAAYRRVMMVAAVLALISAAGSALLIEGKLSPDHLK